MTRDTELQKIVDMRLKDALSSLTQAGRILKRLSTQTEPLTGDDVHALRNSASQATQVARELNEIAGYFAFRTYKDRA